MPMYMDPAGTGKLKPGLKQGAPTIPALTRATISSINADGWTAQDLSPVALDPIGSPQYITVDRLGFDASGSPKTFRENVILTKLVRKAAPYNAQLDTGRTALNTWLYATDTVVSNSVVTNNSTAISPKPICQWLRPDRQTIGNTVRLEIGATHRNARNMEGVACAIITGTDGTTTVTKTVSVSSVLAHPGDKTAVTGLAVDFDTTPFADKAAITFNGRVYPWIGGAASVADSALKADGTANTAGSRSFCPQVYYKNVALAAVWPKAYVNAGASNGAVSTDKTSAKSTPFPDVATAAAGLQSFAAANPSIAPNGVSGCHIVIMAGSQVFGSLAASYTATAGELVIEGDPDVADKSTCILSYGANTTVGVLYPRLQYLREARVNGNYWEIRPAAGGMGTREMVSFDNSAGAAGPINTSSRPWRFIGFTHLGTTSNSMSGDIRLLRGLAGTGLTTTIAWNMVGCATTGGFFGSTAIALPDDGTFIGFNLMMGLTNTALNPAASANVVGFALVQNVFEYTGSANSPAYRPSGDGQTGNTTHFVDFNNTYAGGGQNGGAGRLNAFYDETQNVYRQHTLHASRGNIYAQFNQKSDLFVYGNTSFASDAPNHIGAWSVYYGVDYQGNVSQYVSAFGNISDTNSASQCFIGLGSLYGTTSAAVDPKFKSDQATGPKAPAPLAGAATNAGAGGGDYRTLAGSPAASRVSSAALRFDLDGKPRSAANDDCGAYLVAAA